MRQELLRDVHKLHQTPIETLSSGFWARERHAQRRLELQDEIGIIDSEESAYLRACKSTCDTAKHQQDDCQCDLLQRSEFFWQTCSAPHRSHHLAD